MSITGIQGQLLEVTVNGCSYLKDTQWISRQDPYVLLEYGSTKFSTKTCTDGDKTPTFQEKFVFVLIEGLREVSVSVWNSNTLKSDVFIGSGKILLQKVLSEGYDDTAWPLQTRAGRNAGELRSILHYSNALKPTTSFASSAPPYSSAPPTAQVPLYFILPSTNAAPYATSAYSTPSAPYYPFSASPYPSTYPPPPYLPTPAPATPNYPPPVYPPNSTGYPPSLCSAPPPATYPPPPYPPTSVYPPSPNTYPPPPYPPTSAYPPPPYPPPQ